MNLTNCSRLLRTALATALPLTFGTGLSAQSPIPAIGEQIVTASATSGSYLDTWLPYDSVETLTEAETGGKPSKRRSLLEHVWDFGSVPAGPSATLYVLASRTDLGEGDDFEYFWSADQGANWTSTGYATDATTMSALPDEVMLPAGATGATLWIRVVDTDRTQGHRALDTLTVDYLAVSIGLPSAPAAPAEVYASGKSASTVAVGWTDVAGEDGYRIYRDDGTGPVLAGEATTDEVLFLDAGLTAATNYDYHVVAFNSAGNSLASVTTTGTTRSTTDWQSEVPAFYGQALDVAPSGAVGVAWAENAWAQNPGAWCATRGSGGGSWTVEQVDVRSAIGGIDHSSDFAFAPDGTPSMVYSTDTYEVHFAERRGGLWTRQLLGSTARYGPFTGVLDLAFDPLDPSGQNLAVVYVEASGTKPSSKNYLRVARRIGGAWSHSTATPEYFRAGRQAISFDGSGGLVIAYITQDSRNAPSRVRFARHDGTAWGASQVVDEYPDPAFYHLDMSVDPTTGRAAIVYSPPSSAGPSIRVALQTSTGWSFETVANIDQTNQGVRRIAHDAFGTAFLAFGSDSTAQAGGGFYLARRVAGTWVQETVDPLGFTGNWGVGLAIGALGQVSLLHWSYLFRRDVPIAGVVLSQR